MTEAKELINNLVVEKKKKLSKAEIEKEASSIRKSRDSTKGIVKKFKNARRINKDLKGRATWNSRRKVRKEIAKQDRKELYKGAKQLAKAGGRKVKKGYKKVFGKEVKVKN